MSSWNLSIDNKTATSMRVSWKNLSALLSQSVLHYITVIKSSNGSIVNGNILQGNTTSDVFYGLSPYMEYKLNVLGVNDNRKVYKSSEATEWTEESGIFITLLSQIDYCYSHGCQSPVSNPFTESLSRVALSFCFKASLSAKPLL